MKLKTTRQQKLRQGHEPKSAGPPVVTPAVGYGTAFNKIIHSRYRAHIQSREYVRTYKYIYTSAAEISSFVFQVRYLVVPLPFFLYLCLKGGGVIGELVEASPRAKIEVV